MTVVLASESVVVAPFELLLNVFELSNQITKQQNADNCGIMVEILNRSLG
jgi:hypothetical protein